MLYQIIGPQASGKSRLIKELFPNAMKIHGGHLRRSDSGIRGAKSFVVEEIKEKDYHLLEKFSMSPTLLIQTGYGHTTINNPGPWFYLGHEPLPIKGSLKWNLSILN